MAVEAWGMRQHPLAEFASPAEVYLYSARCTLLFGGTGQVLWPPPENRQQQTNNDQEKTTVTPLKSGALTKARISI